MEGKNVRAVIMLEILGKPAEHIKNILSEIVNKLEGEKNIKIIEKKIAEPKIAEDIEKKGEKDEEVFTSFAEIELETELPKLMMLIFAYMPSHVEIVEPENLKMQNSDLNMFFNELLRKLHQYDEIARTMLIERQIIAKQIEEGRIKLENKKQDFEKARKRKKRIKNN